MRLAMPVLWLALAPAFLHAGRLAPDPPLKPERPFLVYVAAASELAATPETAPKDVSDSVEDIRKHIAKKRQAWLRLVGTPEQAEVVVQVIRREVTTQHGSVVRGQCSILDVHDGGVLGQGGLNSQQVFGIWGTAADDLSGRLEALLQAFYPLIAEGRDERPRPVAVLAAQRAATLLEAGDAEAALAGYQRSLALAPEYGVALRGRGQLLVDRGQPEAGLADLSRVIELELADAASYFARARALAAFGRNAEADDDRRVALSVVPRREPGGQGTFTSADGDGDDLRALVAAELRSRDTRVATLAADAESYRASIGSPSALKESQLQEQRAQRASLAAALASCEAGDQPVCEALATRNATGVARLALPPSSPPRLESIDKARVRVARANLRSGPTTSDPIVRSIEGGELLVLLEREPADGWYRVIHVASTEEGWIHEKLLELALSELPADQRPSPFRGRRLEEQEAAPRVTVQNDGDLVMTLTVGDDRHTIPPRSTRSIEVPTGSHRYVGAAPGVIPAVGSQLFERGYEYSWRFWIVSKTTGL